jgi:bifunctional non-homologous end joining protein LigD
VEAERDEFLRVACAHGLEGIIAKHREKPSRSGRNDWWRKITCTRRDSFVIVGYGPSVVPGAIGRLLLAARKGDELVYVGGCGTGWSREESVKLRELLEEIATKSPAVNLRRKNAVFTEPVLVAEVEYRTWTEDWKLRHPSFKGIREREDDATVYTLT